MKIPPVKGTRDFYPEEMAVHNWIVDGWKRASVLSGFEEYDGPIFEYLQMYQVKSGDEIAEQLFSFKDRGERDLAIRPEITPTLARMVNQKINALPKPIKWFSVPRLCRAERPQKGRLREFFQWNIDIIGEYGTDADVEVIYTTLNYLRRVGLTDKDVKVKISNRKLLALFLKRLGMPEDKLISIYSVLDKKPKLPEEIFEQMLREQISDNAKVSKVMDFMNADAMPQLKELINIDESEEFNAYNEIGWVLDTLKSRGVGDFCTYDPSIVRGLAYYTGIVFEVHAIGSELRAICGGGRFDNLLRDFGGPPIPATGMGMGDCVLEILLKEKGLIKLNPRELDYFVALVDKGGISIFNKLIAKLREQNFITDFSFNLSCKLEPPLRDALEISIINLRKQLKAASERNARKCIIIGNEIQTGNITLKNMSTGNQQTIPLKEFLENPSKF